MIDERSPNPGVYPGVNTAHEPPENICAGCPGAADNMCSHAFMNLREPGICLDKREMQEHERDIAALRGAP